MSIDRRFLAAGLACVALLSASCGDAGNGTGSNPVPTPTPTPTPAPAPAKAEAQTSRAAAPPPVKTTGVRFESVLQKLPHLPRIPVQLVPHPDGGSFFVLGRNGDIHHYDRPLEAFPLAKETSPESSRKFAGRITKVKIDGSFEKGDMGTLSMTLDPDFLVNRFFYIWYADREDKNVLLDRFVWSEKSDLLAASRVNVIRFSRRDPPAPYHMGGVAKFLPDKTLLLMVGDAERPELSQDRRDLNGKMLRIRPKHGPEGGYEVPADNPHVGDPAWAPEIVAHGLRAPFRGWLRRGRDLWFGDVGAIYEEIDVWKGRPVDFGWGHGPITDGDDSPEGSVKPLVKWSQNTDFAADDPDYAGETRLAAGFGVIYEDFATDRYHGFLTGKAIFFDIMRGWVRAGAVTEDDRIADHRHIGHRQFIADMVLGRDGYIYGVTWDAPVSIFRVRASHEVRLSPKDAGTAASAGSDTAGPRREHAATRPAAGK